MSDTFFSRIQTDLESLRENKLYRTIPELAEDAANFSSNDYLGLAVNAELRMRVQRRAHACALGSGSSRLLPGYHAGLRNTEHRFAEFLTAPEALLFNSGFDANAALLTTLPQRHDLILYDERSHASSIDGVRASQAGAYRFQHNNVGHLLELLDRHSPDHRQVFIVVESVYSMDGDLAPLEAIDRVAREHRAILIVDEAHATGVTGRRGEGLVAYMGIRDRHVISMHTCGKALGASGAVVASDPLVRDYLINRARPLIFTTAMPPLIAAQIEESLQLLEERGEAMIAGLSERAANVRTKLRSQLKHWQVPEGTTPIIPIVIGSNEVSLVASSLLKQQGYWVSAIRPPSVPAGTSRLRLNINYAHTVSQLERVVELVVAAESQLVQA